MHPSDEAMFYALVPAADRRAGDRRTAGVSATVARVINGIEVNAFNVRICDVSFRGVGIRSALPLDAATVYRLRIATGFQMLIRIVRSRARRDGMYDVGALYATTTVPPSVQALCRLSDAIRRAA